MKKIRLRSPSKKQIAFWREELAEMERLAQEAIDDRGQTDTIWQTTAERLRATLDAVDQKNSVED
jgi:hypothetical protein